MNEFDAITDEAKAIGAVNTIIPTEKDGKVELVGDNTDWIAIHALSQRHMTPSAKDEGLAALVIGAGGSARAAIYAMHKLGASKIWLFNRTPANAVLLAKQLPKEWNVQVTESMKDMNPLPRVVVSNVPADGTSAEVGAQAGLIFPKEIFAHPEGGVVIDMSCEYGRGESVADSIADAFSLCTTDKPYHTPLLGLAEKVNASRIENSGNAAAGRWAVIPGVVILLEQGCEQFERWTGVAAPRAEIEQAAWSKYLGPPASS
jgi:pentafunctional AROM polypeptide